MRKRQLIVIAGISFLLTSVHALQGADTPKIIIEQRYISDVPSYEAASEVQVDGVKAIYYEGPEYQGKPSKVFAFYGCPPVKPEEKVPAIILVHGGGGTAFAEWVKLWVARGYAAIAMDTVGCVPISETTRSPIPGGGPTCGPDFVHLEDPLSDQWPYYVENAIARARTLLGSFPEIDDKRIGITGISWGGFLSSIAAALDKRYAFAVHVYGCGFLKEKSAWMGELNEPGKERWSEMFDPSIYLGQTNVPVLWVTGTNDVAYPIESLMKSYALVKNAPVTLRIAPGMAHGHPEGWSPPEIAAFADSICLKGTPLPKISAIETSKGGKARARFEASTDIVRADLIIAKRGDTDWKTRTWESLPARISVSSGEVSTTIPPDAQYYFFNIYDDRGFLVSSPVSEDIGEK